ncbi:hypothetical protein BG004_004920 [Podila humilis]|nr:hypothetical protein BG004_004920 [Podila humilis]
MPKHVYPPWHSRVQKGIFVVAVIVCIAVPVIYGESKAISSTTVIVVLLVYIGLWVSFWLWMRYGVKSYAVESTLPIHTPTPAPLLRLHAPSARNAVPLAPVLKISTAQHSSSSASEDDNDPESLDDPAKQHLRTQPPPPTAAPPSSPVNFRQPSPDINDAVASNGVTFQTRHRRLTGDSTNSQIYPTFATYRQQQHANFDAFAQRIRKALETANAQHRYEQEQLIDEQKAGGEQEESIHLRATQDCADSETTGEGMTSLHVLPALSATHAMQLIDVDGASIQSSSGATNHSHALSVSTIKGRPRSSSAASIMSNLSENIRLGPSFFSRSSGVAGVGGSGVTGRSRAGSDASVLAPQSLPLQSHPFYRDCSSTFSNPHEVDLLDSSPSSRGSLGQSSITTMAALASATAVASAMFMPRGSVCTQSCGDSVTGSRADFARGARRQFRVITHPLAETTNMDDDEKQASSEGDDAERSDDDDESLDIKAADPDEEKKIETFLDTPGL